MNKYSYILLFYLLIISCNQNPSQAEKNYIKNLEENSRALEKEIQEISSKIEPINITQGTNQKSEYSYLLTITSIDIVERSFNLKISSTDLTKTAAVKIMLENQITPFERKLEPGEHIIVVDHIAEEGFIKSKVIGILNGETMGSASTDDSGVPLKAGPSGRYSAGEYYLNHN